MCCIGFNELLIGNAGNEIIFYHESASSDVTIKFTTLFLSIFHWLDHPVDRQLYLQLKSLKAVN